MHSYGNIAYCSYDEDLTSVSSYYEYAVTTNKKVSDNLPFNFEDRM